MNKKIPLVVIAGPTGVGKTAVSIELAKRFGAQIISADSMQIYRHMNIGTAKVTEAEAKGIVHHMIDIAEPTENFSVCDYVRICSGVITDLHERGILPIIAGGTGLYVDSLVNGVEFSPCCGDEEYREKLRKLADEKGADFLHDMLRRVDPVSADKIHANNVKRVIRALEYYHTEGEPISVHNARSKAAPSPYDCLYIYLTRDREKLYERINTRVDAMIADGLVDEVSRLIAMGATADNTAMQAIGYKEIIAYLSGECTLDEAVEELKINTRHYAKRQMTWFAPKADVTVNLSETGGVDAASRICTEYIQNFLDRRANES